MSDLPVLEPQGVVRCCKCPQERRQRDPGWYWMDLNSGRRYRVYVCPRHYLQFAAAERGRWSPVHEDLPRTPDPAAPPATAPALAPFAIGAVPGHDGSWVI